MQTSLDAALTPTLSTSFTVTAKHIVLGCANACLGTLFLIVKSGTSCIARHLLETGHQLYLTKMLLVWRAVSGSDTLMSSRGSQFCGDSISN